MGHKSIRTSLDLITYDFDWVKIILSFMDLNN